MMEASGLMAGGFVLPRMRLYKKGIPRQASRKDARSEDH